MKKQTIIQIFLSLSLLVVYGAAYADVSPEHAAIITPHEVVRHRDPNA